MAGAFFVIPSIFLLLLLGVVELLVGALLFLLDLVERLRDQEALEAIAGHGSHHLLEEIETAELRKLVEQQQQAVTLLTAMPVSGLIFHQSARDLTDEETHQRHEARAI